MVTSHDAHLKPSRAGQLAEPEESGRRIAERNFPQVMP